MEKASIPSRVGRINEDGLPVCPSDGVGWRSYPPGFTMIELMFSFLIVSILATVGILSLSHYKSVACDVVAKYDLSNFIKVQTVHAVNHDDKYIGYKGDVISGIPSVPSTLTINGFSVSQGVTITVTSDSPYSADARHVEGKKTYSSVLSAGIITEHVSNNTGGTSGTGKQQLP